MPNLFFATILVRRRISGLPVIQAQSWNPARRRSTIAARAKNARQNPQPCQGTTSYKLTCTRPVESKT